MKVAPISTSIFTTPGHRTVLPGSAAGQLLVHLRPTGASDDHEALLTWCTALEESQVSQSYATACFISLEECQVSRGWQQTQPHTELQIISSTFTLDLLA